MSESKTEVPITEQASGEGEWQTVKVPEDEEEDTRALRVLRRQGFDLQLLKPHREGNGK